MNQSIYQSIQREDGPTAGQWLKSRSRGGGEGD